MKYTVDISIYPHFFRLSWIKYCHFSFIEGITEVEEFDAMRWDVQKIVFSGLPLTIRQSSRYPPSYVFSHGNEEKTAVDRLLYS